MEVYAPPVAQRACVDTSPDDGLSCSSHKDAGDCQQARGAFVAAGHCRLTCGLCGSGARGEMITVAPGVQVPAETLVPLPERAPLPTDPAFCDMSSAAGPCRAFIPRWFFDSPAKSCAPFVWGGCGGNANNFASQADCDRTAVQYCGSGVRTGVFDANAAEALLARAVPFAEPPTPERAAGGARAAPPPAVAAGAGGAAEDWLLQAPPSEDWLQGTPKAPPSGS
eukprot:scaffold13.g216.t1